jgi:hypothetical protein
VWWTYKMSADDHRRLFARLEGNPHRKGRGRFAMPYIGRRDFKFRVIRWRGCLIFEEPASVDDFEAPPANAPSECEAT